jgi:glycosyltransferase EpsF
MAGDGPRRELLKREVEAQHLQDRVSLPGLWDDVASLMVHGFDVHVLPSIYEGLPIVGLEAAASGLYTVCSDTITKDYTEPIAQRVKVVSLKASVEHWADEVETAISKRIPAQEGIAIIQKSPFSIDSSLESLLDIYRRRLRPQE